MYDPSGLYVDPILSNFAVGFREQNLYAERLFPITSLNTQSGRYRVFDRSDWMIYKSRREPGTAANEVSGRKWSEDEFRTQEHSLQAPVYDEEEQQLNSLGGLANATFGGALSIDPERDATALVTRSISLEHEQKVSGAIRDVSNYPGNHVLALSGASKWSDYTGGTASTSDPVANLKTAVQRIYVDTGEWVNTMIVPFDAVGVIENHPRVVVRFQNFALTNNDAWKFLLGIPEVVNLNVIVVDSKFNDAASIDDDENIVSFWGQDIWLGVVNPGDGINIHTFGKTFAQKYPTGDLKPTERWYDINIKTTKIRTNFKYDIKVVSGLAGYLFTNAVAAIT